MTIRFTLGIVKELIFPPVRWVLVLYAIRAILAYTTAAFSYPYNSDAEINEEEQIND